MDGTKPQEGALKTFRCLFLTDADVKTATPKIVTVVAEDARSAASSAAAQFPTQFNGLSLRRIDVEDERGLAYMWQPRAAGFQPRAA